MSERFMGEFDPKVTYKKGDVVTLNGEAYRRVRDDGGKVNPFQTMPYRVWQKKSAVSGGLVNLLGPGGGGGTSDAVQYIPQELTTEQQMQARKNLSLYRKEVAVGERVGGSNNAQWTEANGMYVDQQFDLRTDAFDVLSGVLGKTFVVYWGEDKFTVKTERDSSGVVYVGNANFVSGSDDGTGLPFAIVDAIALGAGTMAAGRTGPNTVDIFAIEETITPIPPEYLPNEEWTFTLEDGSTVTKKVVISE